MANVYVKIGVGVLCVAMLWLGGDAILGVRRFAQEQARAQQMLSSEINQLFFRLPEAAQTDILPKMPFLQSHLWQDAVFYYPDLDLYAYRFAPRYQYDMNTHQREGIQNPHIPDVLERRSVYLKAENGKWHCYATVPKHLRVANCDEVQIVGKLTVDAHKTAYQIKDMCVLPLLREMAKWRQSPKMSIFQLNTSPNRDNPQQAAHIHIAKHLPESPAEVVLILQQDPSYQSRARDWRIYRDRETHISGVILLGHAPKLYGLPRGTPVINGAACPAIENTWQSAFRQPDFDGSRWVGDSYETWTTNRDHLTWQTENTVWENGQYRPAVMEVKPSWKQ